MERGASEFTSNFVVPGFSIDGLRRRQGFNGKAGWKFQRDFVVTLGRKIKINRIDAGRR